MGKKRVDGLETKQNLLVAAVEVFSDKGFYRATNADICKKAGANIAAVNYHFGSKENLYIESWKYSFDKSLKNYPPDGGVPSNASAHERLYGRILAFMQRIADSETHDFDIIHKEIANPTGLLTDTIEKRIELLERDFIALIEEILGDAASEPVVRLCYMSIQSQCFGPMLYLRHRKAGFDIPRRKDIPPDYGIKELAEHIMRFSLAGINGICRKESD